MKRVWAVLILIYLCFCVAAVYVDVTYHHIPMWTSIAYTAFLTVFIFGGIQWVAYKERRARAPKYLNKRSQ